MFKREVSPITTFKGFAVKSFRQGRTNLAERHLTRTHVLFIPTRGVVGVFLSDALTIVDELLLTAAWRAQGCPEVTLPDARHIALFGRLLALQAEPFAGYNDFWMQEDTIHVAFKRGEDQAMLQAHLNTFARKTLLELAESALQRYLPYLKRQPQRIEISPLRPRILGHCTREGIIRLNESLCQWPASVMEETLAHELVHLEHFNHSPAFWRRLSELLPDWLPRSLAHYLA
jgi:hypothetical protein